MRKHFVEEGKEVKLTFFVPESLLIKESIDVFVRGLEERLDDFEVVVIPSVGEYYVNGSRIRFVSSVENIATSMLMYFVETKPEILFIESPQDSTFIP